jgi:hypothetical protein
MKKEALRIAGEYGVQVVYGIVDKDGMHSGEIITREGEDLQPVVGMLKSIINQLEMPVDGVC